MDFFQLAHKRHSVRKFSDRPVAPDKLALVLEAGRLAPTAGNRQPQRILVIDSEESLGALRACTSFLFNAPMALLVCYDKSVSWKRPHDQMDMGIVDASIVASHMMLQIADLGLGTTWAGHFDPARIREAFALPDYLVPVALLPLGYPSADAVPHVLHEQRLPLTETVFYNTFTGMVPGKDKSHAHHYQKNKG